MTEITIDMYRDALHIYLKHAFPDDDESYYSKWAFLVSPTHDFFEPDSFNDVPFLPREVRFGCYCSGNTKLRCYKTGFMFDTNHIGDSDDIIKQVKEIKKEVEDEWRRVGIPVHGDRLVDIEGLITSDIIESQHNLIDNVENISRDNIIKLITELSDVGKYGGQSTGCINILIHELKRRNNI
jgi:hypothetical protein